MSRGETPHTAMAIAHLYNASKTPYKEAYSDYLLKTSFRRAIQGVSVSMDKFANALREATKAIHKFSVNLRGDNV